MRRISLRDLVIVSLGRELRLSADSALNGSRLAITSFTAASGDLAIEMHGSVDFEPKVVASLQATSELLDFDSLLALATAFMGTASQGSAGAPATDVRVSLRVTAPRARAAGMELTEFDGVMTLYEGELSLDPLTFNLFGGQHEGWLSASLGETLDVRVGSSVANIDVAQLAKLVELAPSRAGWPPPAVWRARTRYRGGARIGAGRWRSDDRRRHDTKPQSRADGVVFPFTSV